MNNLESLFNGSSDEPIENELFNDFDFEDIDDLDNEHNINVSNNPELDSLEFDVFYHSFFTKFIEKEQFLKKNPKTYLD